MDIRMIPAIGPMRVEKNDTRHDEGRKFFRFKGKIEQVKFGNGKTMIVIETDEYISRLADIAGSDVIVSSD